MAAINPPVIPNIVGEQVRFSKMLTNVCGLITPPMRDAVMVDQGIGSIIELQSLTLKEIDQMVTTIIKTDRRAAD
jgi:predicted transcriptional regulator